MDHDSNPVTTNELPLEERGLVYLSRWGRWVASGYVIQSQKCMTRRIMEGMISLRGTYFRPVEPEIRTDLERIDEIVNGSIDPCLARLALWRYVQGESLERIAQRLRCTKGTVSRARLPELHEAVALRYEAAT